MLRSTDRIIVTHAGALPRSEALGNMVRAQAEGAGQDSAALSYLLRKEIAEIVKRQLDCGIDSVNDGELSKTNFTYYCKDRITGHATRPYVAGKSPAPLNITARDLKQFGGYFDTPRAGFARTTAPRAQTFCVGPLKYVGQSALRADLENFKMVLASANVPEAYLPSNTPGTIEHWMYNDYYRSTEEFLTAIAECMREEYEAIVNAGFLLQIDDPDLPDGWLMYPQMTVADYRKYAMLRVEALNHALRNIPKDKVRLHVCWGSYHGPHAEDIPLKDIIDIIFAVKASSFSIEAANPAHEHEWNVFEMAKLPEGASLIPGVVGHCTDFIENAELVAQRLLRYAKLVGRENLIAGTDCGLRDRVGHPTIAWAKLKALSDGARLASKELWGRA